MDNGKILLVTGASSEVGASLIQKTANNYDKIWAHYHSSKGMIDDLINELGDKIIPVQADFRDMDSTKQLIEKIQASGEWPGHIVHLSASSPASQRFPKNEWNHWQEEIDTSLRSAVMILQEFIPKMAKMKSGKIVMVLTSYLFGIPPKFQSSYITVKYALLGLVRTLAAEYAPKGITINAVSPDMMETKFLSNLSELAIEQSAKDNPRGRNVKVEECVPAIEYFLSSASDMVTGQNIGITGGAR